jgi:hypothetical protein
MDPAKDASAHNPSSPSNTPDLLLTPLETGFPENYWNSALL